MRKARQVQRPTGAKMLVHGGQDVKDRHVIFDILLCVVIASLETDAFMAIIACIDMLMVGRDPARSRRKREVQGCVSQNSGPKKSILRKAGQTRLNASAGHTIKNSQDAIGTKVKFGKEKGHFEVLSKMVNLMSEILARPSLRKEHLRKPQDKKNVPAKQHRIWRETYMSSRPRTKLRFILLWK